MLQLREVVGGEAHFAQSSLISSVAQHTFWPSGLPSATLAADISKAGAPATEGETGREMEGAVPEACRRRRSLSSLRVAQCTRARVQAAADLALWDDLGSQMEADHAAMMQQADQTMQQADHEASASGDAAAHPPAALHAHQPGMMLPMVHQPVLYGLERYEFVRDIGSGNFGVARLNRDKLTIDG